MIHGFSRASVTKVVFSQKKVTKVVRIFLELRFTVMHIR
jgi:hypothetical protein